MNEKTKESTINKKEKRKIYVNECAWQIVSRESKKNKMGFKQNYDQTKWSRWD